MTEKKEYRNAIRSRRMIRNAFLELLNEKEFKKITVTDIVTRADLNRSTFYAHYPDVYGIVEEIQDEISKRYIAVIEQATYRNFLEDPMPYLKNVSSILEENLDFFQRIGHSMYVHQQLDNYKKLLAEDIVNRLKLPEELTANPSFCIRIHFFFRARNKI